LSASENKRFRHSTLYDMPETPPRATLGWSYSGLTGYRVLEYGQ